MDAPRPLLPRSVPSPCRNICKLTTRAGMRLCIGCGRTLAEIEAWPLADDRARSAIRMAAAARLSKA